MNQKGCKSIPKEENIDMSVFKLFGPYQLTLNPINVTEVKWSCSGWSPWQAQKATSSDCPMTFTLTPGSLMDSGSQWRVMSYINHWLKRHPGTDSPVLVSWPWYQILKFNFFFPTVCHVLIRSSLVWSSKLLIVNHLGLEFAFLSIWYSIDDITECRRIAERKD